MIGVNLQLFDGLTEKASLTGIQAIWWDDTEPSDGSMAGFSVDVTTDGDGYINLDLSAVSILSIGDYGFLMLYKLDALDHMDSLVFAGKVLTSDIVSGDALAEVSRIRVLTASAALDVPAVPADATVTAVAVSESPTTASAALDIPAVPTVTSSTVVA